MQICANKTMRRVARRVLLGAFVMLFSLSANAQKAVNDSIFKGHIYNAEYQVWIDMDFYNSTVMVPRWQIFGAVPGYLGAVTQQDGSTIKIVVNRKWLKLPKKLIFKKQ